MQFFLFLIFMSFVSFALAYITYAFLVKLLGNSSDLSRYSQLLVIPIVVIGYDLLLVTSPYRYWLGSLPIIIMLAILFHFYVIKGGTMSTPNTPREEYQGNRSMKRAKKFAKRKGI